MKYKEVLIYKNKYTNNELQRTFFVDSVKEFEKEKYKILKTVYSTIYGFEYEQFNFL